ncbi:MAG: response regulator transcription factor [Bacteroidales bacterium]|nr:response regulator transcription factor [Bacteroidales bacterium]
MIKLALVDDHKILRDGIKISLLGNDEILLVLECASSEELLKQYKKYNPDVFVLDMNLPGIEGDELTKLLIQDNQQSKIIILSALTDEDSVMKAIKAGAKGYLSKDAGTDELLIAIKSVYNGEEYFGGQISKIVFRSYTKLFNQDKHSTESPLLSEREIEILKCFADGLTYKETADKLFISPRTVETHKNSIMSKLGLKTLADLIKWAIKNNIIQL